MKKNICLFVVGLMVFYAGFRGTYVSAQNAGKDRRSGRAISPMNNTPQTLPFSQNWTTNLITTANDWGPVPGIVGYQGIDLTTVIGFDARNLLVPDPETAPQVFANTTTANGSGGVGEMDTEANPTIALQGSGTGDAPHIVIYLNTTGQSNIRVSYNARDIDGTTDNSVQQINTQYRVGNTGNFINVPGGYIPDATTGPSIATLVTPINVTLPAAANNQPLVQVRIMTINAPSTDEWVGIDDISVTTVASPATANAVVDFNGDLRTDFAVLRNIGVGPGGQVRWFINHNGAAGGNEVNWGIGTDSFVPEDYDGDNKTDIAVWRSGAANVAAFYILNSSNGTIRIELFGQTGDDPTIVDDYDGDGKADPAVFREAAQGVWYYRGSLNNPSGAITFVPWGTTGDTATSGDYDGDGKADYVIQRSAGGQNQFWLFQTTAGTSLIAYGLPSDSIVPGDFDGDRKADIALVRVSGGSLAWYVLPSSTGIASSAPIATFGADTDFIAQGDYDGDGRTDVAVWRPNPDPTLNFFHVLASSNGAYSVNEWGTDTDVPVAGYNNH